MLPALKSTDLAVGSATVEASARVRTGYVCMIAYTNYVQDARVRRQAERLAAEGFNVLCLSAAVGETPKRFTLDGVDVQELPVPKYRGRSTGSYIRAYVSFLWSSTIICARLLRHGTLHVVHAHNLPDFLVFAGLLPRLAGRKVVLDVHDSMPETFAAKFSNGSLVHRVLCLQERVSALVAHRVFCVNHPQRDLLVARGIPRRKTFVVMNTPDPRIFNAARAEFPRVADKGFHIVYHGTMVERLGVDLIIRAVDQLRERIPGIRLHLWGGGDDLESFQRLAHGLNVHDLVEFRPKGVPLEQLPAELRQMHVGIVANRQNVAAELMLPVKLMEYVSLGIPTVVPRLPTISHYFGDDMVSYYQSGDVVSLASAIFQLYNEPDRRTRQVRAAGAFLEVCGWERQGAELVRLYRRLMES